jgi:hypothetical protein
MALKASNATFSLISFFFETAPLMPLKAAMLPILVIADPARIKIISFDLLNRSSRYIKGNKRRMFFDSVKAPYGIN